jgi:hypothetical protein
MNRRTVLFSAASSIAFGTAAKSSELRAVEAYRNPGCGCCEQWAAILKDSGFAVTMSEDDDLAARQAALGIGEDVAGCHLGIANGFVFSGHVPPADIHRFLAAPPEGAIGLTVPGMPMGSPGMGAPGSGEPYEVLLLLKGKPPKVYATYPG